MEIIEAGTPEHVDLVRQLLREYGDWLSRSHAVDLSYQGFDDEIASLPGEYARPKGRLLLALEAAQPVGCAALRPFDATSCELKRMYVRPAARGMGVGKKLVLELVDESKRMGYRLMRLDTLDFMAAAQQIYASLGFVPAGAYYSVPRTILPRTRFMELPLV